MTAKPPICDYEGSDYRTRFWEGQGRDYEDQVERIALRRLMPDTGRNLIDIGAGFGRLADEYYGYERVVLFDYSTSLLREARDRLAGDSRYIFVAGDWYHMPFVTGLFDSLIQVRTIHHAANVPALFNQLARIVTPGGSYVLEFASKRHIKSVFRYWFRDQDWSPFNQEPVEFVELNFDFHPRWMRQQLQTAGFKPRRSLTVSHFRSPILKRFVPTRFLIQMDQVLQLTGDFWQLTPSVFIGSRSAATGQVASKGSFFACPACQSSLHQSHSDRMVCTLDSCAKSWMYQDGIYNFKEHL